MWFRLNLKDILASFILREGCRLSGYLVRLQSALDDQLQHEDEAAGEHEREDELHSGAIAALLTEVAPTGRHLVSREKGRAFRGKSSISVQDLASAELRPVKASCDFFDWLSCLACAKTIRILLIPI